MEKTGSVYATPDEIRDFENLIPPGRSRLSRPAIKYELSRGNIIMNPYDEASVGSNGIDVTLGEHMWSEIPTVSGGSRVLNPFDFNEVKQHWQLTQPINAGEYMDKHGTLNGISRSARIFLIEPGVLYLGHTDQFIGGTRCVSSDMHARSSVGRNGITVCKCADQGGVGFFNRWTMEISNQMSCAVILAVGMRIAQISFEMVDTVGGADYVSGGGKYQSSNRLEELIKSWTPMQLLPRLDRDREVQNGFATSHS